MLNSVKYLEKINDFPKIGLIYYENSGENLLRLYLEKIFRIKTGSNLKQEKINSPFNVYNLSIAYLLYLLYFF